VEARKRASTDGFETDVACDEPVLVDGLCVFGSPAGLIALGANRSRSETTEPSRAEAMRWWTCGEMRETRPPPTFMIDRR
jgi:hypothetical protein